MEKVTPANYVIALFGGTRKLTRLLNEQLPEKENGLYPSTVQRWTEGSNAGLVPSKYHSHLLDMADKLGLHLTAEILIRGAKEAPVTVMRSTA